jgi:hypothetical protein
MWKQYDYLNKKICAVLYYICFRRVYHGCVCKVINIY